MTEETAIRIAEGVERVAYAAETLGVLAFFVLVAVCLYCVLKR
jgi:hypothetical protein